AVMRAPYGDAGDRVVRIGFGFVCDCADSAPPTSPIEREPFAGLRRALSGFSGKPRHHSKPLKLSDLRLLPRRSRNDPFTLPQLDGAGSTPVARSLRKLVSQGLSSFGASRWRCGTLSRFRSRLDVCLCLARRWTTALPS